MAGIATVMPAIGQSLKTGNTGRTKPQLENVVQPPNENSVDNGNNPAISIISLVIGVGALAYAVYINRNQSKKIKQQNKEIAELKDKTNKINNTLNGIGADKKVNPKHETSGKESEQKWSTDTMSRTQKQPKQERITVQTKQPQTTPQKTVRNIVKYYANATQRDGSILLNIMGNEMAEYLPFELRSDSISQCSVYYNNSSFAQIVDSLETKVLPYSDYKISNKNRPTRIVTLTPGKAVKKGETWKMTTKPKLEIL